MRAVAMSEGRRKRSMHIGAPGVCPEIFKRLGSGREEEHGESAVPWLRVMRNTDVQRRGSTL